MTSKNIKRLLPFIILIAISIGIVLNVARTNGLLTQASLGRNAKLNLCPVSRPKSLNGKEMGLGRADLREDAIAKDLVSKVALRESLNLLDDHLRGERL